MATAISLPRAPLITPRACTPRRLVHVSAARASPPRGGGRVGRRSLTVPAVAGASSSGLAPDTSVPAWDALGGVSVLAAGTGNAVALTDLWDSAEVLLSSSVIWAHAAGQWSHTAGRPCPGLPSVPSYADAALRLRAQGVAVVALLRHFGCFCW
jgi:hypothetical protein